MELFDLINEILARHPDWRVSLRRSDELTTVISMSRPDRGFIERAISQESLSQAVCPLAEIRYRLFEMEYRLENGSVKEAVAPERN